MPTKSIFLDETDEFSVQLNDGNPELVVKFSPPPTTSTLRLVCGVDNLVEFHTWLGKEIDRLRSVPAQS